MPPVIAGIVTGIAAVGSAIGTAAGVAGTIATALGASTAIAAAATAVAKTLIISGLMAGASKLAIAAGLMGGTPDAMLSRLSATFDPQATRKAAFGIDTALATDILYSEPSGDDQEYVDYIICCAAHKARIKRIFLDTKLMWSEADGVATEYQGYAHVAVRNEGTAANAISINGGAVWSAADCRLTGCCYFHLRIKRTGNEKTAASPFAGGLTGRMTVVGDGMDCYDPRLDTTAGGAGAHRVHDQTTWAPTRSHSLHQLTALLGWRIGGEVSVGAGVVPGRLDIAGFAAAANIDDEAVPLAAGGTQVRFAGAAVFADSDSAVDMAGALGQAAMYELQDVTGRIGIRKKINDLAGPLLELGPADVLGAYSYAPQLALHEAPNIVRGRYTDPSEASLFQMVPYAEVALPSIDGNDRYLTLDLPTIEDPLRARRVANQALQRVRHGGQFSADFGPRAWALRPGDALRLTFPMCGLQQEIFRVVSAGYKVVVDAEGAKRWCPMVLERDSPDVYAPPAVDLAPPPAIAAVPFDPARTILLAVENAVTAPQPGNTRRIVVGTSQSVEVLIEDGASVSISGGTVIREIAGPTSTATATLRVHYSTDDVAWLVAATYTGNEPIPEPISVDIDPPAIIANSSGGPLLYRIRTTLTLSAGVSGIADTASNFYVS